MEVLRQWERCAAVAPGHERDAADEAITQALCWREIERHLDHVGTVLVVGAGTGAYSIPLAGRGYQVTHFDPAPAALAVARQEAEHLDTITFVQGDAVDLYRFPNRSFDLVLNLDGAISQAGAGAEQVLRESCRVTGGTLIVTVTNRAQLVTIATSSSLEETGTLNAPVYVIFDNGEWQGAAAPNDQHEQTHAGPMKAFLAAELRAILDDADLNIWRIGGIGSLVSLCSVEAIHRACENTTVFEQFVALCDRFDHEILPDGPGSRQRPGLIGVAKRP